MFLKSALLAKVFLSAGAVSVNTPANLDAVPSLRTMNVTAPIVFADPADDTIIFQNKSEQHIALELARTNYQSIAMTGGWKSIPSGDKIEFGDEDPRIPSVRLRLSAEGFYNDDQRYVLPRREGYNPALYDADLETAIKDFQTAHGLDEDGVIGRGTVEAMNESVESKLSKIEYSLAEWESYGDMGETFIWANIPSYTAQAYRDGALEVSMKTIVGSPKTKTPVFQDNIEYIISNPKWFIPVGLFKRQKLRKLQADPGYAARGNYKIYSRETNAELDPYSVNWSDLKIAYKVQMVQDSGPTNALGSVKIIFPNAYSVYLHGTPDTHLFAKSRRALSSGCIRLEDPRKMANWIASIDAQVDQNDFNQAMDENERTRFTLAEQIPVHITYIPVTVNKSGQPMFWRDVYNDLPAPQLADELYENFEPVISDEPKMTMSSSAQASALR